MIQFLLAFAVFLASHSLPAATGLRGALIACIGRRAYVTAYSLVSLAAIAWLIVATVTAPYVLLWPTSRATALVPIVAMLPASVLAVGGLLAPSPLSISFRSGLPDPQRLGLASLLRHPVLWAFFLWSASHMVANGDLIAVILFASLAAFSLAGMKRMERRARQRLSEADYATAVALTSGGPVQRLKRAALVPSLLQIGTGVVVYVALLHLHGPVIGLDPLTWLS